MEALACQRAVREEGRIRRRGCGLWGLFNACRGSCGGCIGCAYGNTCSASFYPNWVSRIDLFYVEREPIICDDILLMFGKSFSASIIAWYLICIFSNKTLNFLFFYFPLNNFHINFCFSTKKTTNQKNKTKKVLFIAQVLACFGYLNLINL